MFPYFPFHNEVVIARATIIQDVERCRVEAQPSRYASIDPAGIDSVKEKEVEDEFVEDSKDGILAPPLSNRKAA